MCEKVKSMGVSFSTCTQAFSGVGREFQDGMMEVALFYNQTVIVIIITWLLTVLIKRLIKRFIGLNSEFQSGHLSIESRTNRYMSILHRLLANYGKYTVSRLVPKTFFPIIRSHSWPLMQL